MKKADRISLETLTLGLFAFNVWQARDAMPLKASV
jgi:hypothetical protein